jgi:hypothetical protein
MTILDAPRCKLPVPVRENREPLTIDTLQDTRLSLHASP